MAMERHVELVCILLCMWKSGDKVWIMGLDALCRSQSPRAASQTTIQTKICADRRVESMPLLHGFGMVGLHRG